MYYFFPQNEAPSVDALEVAFHALVRMPLGLDQYPQHRNQYQSVFVSRDTRNNKFQGCRKRLKY